MAIKKKAHQFYNRTMCWYRKAWKPKPLFPVPLPTRVLYFFRGFSANEYIWYDLKHHDYRDYISEYERVLSRNINGEYKLILDDKLLFEEMFGKYVKVPEIMAWVKDGLIYGLHGNDIDNSNVVSAIRSRKDAVVKWEVGYEGKGTYIVHTLEDGTFDINGKRCGEDELVEVCKKNQSAIICEYMHQSAFEDGLFDGSTNTLRIVCAKKKGEREARIIRAVQRIGTRESMPVDNVSAGALAAHIDLETGELSSAMQAKSHDQNAILKTYDCHPDTGRQIRGLCIPGWDSIKRQITQLTNRFPYLNFVAWDVLLTEEGMCLIEGNASAGLMMFQVSKGVRNDDIGDIYRSYGIIK